MTPTEIADALEAIAAKPFDPNELPYAFAAATGNAPATISKLRPGRRSLNKSGLPGGVLMNRKFHYAPADPGDVEDALARLRSDKQTACHAPAILLATDGEELIAEHPASGETLRCAYAEMHRHFGFFLPAAGMTRFKAAEENEVDVKATGKLARLYDALARRNPEWTSGPRRHDLNRFMTRLIFCLFAEDVGIFPKDQFTRLVTNHAGTRGDEAHVAIGQAFAAMNRPAGERGDLQDWTRELAYVNGGLFAGASDAPVFDRVAWGCFQEAAGLHWRKINPDIFGSMIQSVADASMRGELGMHYTSVPNILKVLGPLFLDELDAEIQANWNKPKALRRVLDRMARLRVFDPACGSGNFLVIAYRELRARETKVLKRLEDLTGERQIQMWSAINLDHFCGIEIADFAAETAKLALFIAEYQANVEMEELFGAATESLPLHDGGRIIHANALHADWEEVCGGSGEIVVASNPPFAGAKSQTPEQKRDRNRVFEADGIQGYKCLDLVAAWFHLAAKFVRSGESRRFGIVATSSITQGRQAPALWPHILNDLQINFAHRPFKWRNNAAANAAVDCVIVGCRRTSDGPVRLYDDGVVKSGGPINAYLIQGPLVYGGQQSRSLFGLPQMLYGGMPNDGGNLLLSAAEKDRILERHPEAERFLRPFVGTTELIEGKERFCIWIEDEDLDIARAIPPIAERVERTRRHRLDSTNVETQNRAGVPHRFWHPAPPSASNQLIVASASSERRPVLPADFAPAEVVPSNLCFVIPNAPPWTFALVASRLHLVWIEAICGKLERRYRYSNTLGWHTFPVPRMTASQLDELNESARRILRTRAAHHPKTIADLYDPEKMPDDLREAHRRNDELLETMYVGRPFKNDTERLEKLFKLYAARSWTPDARASKGAA
ncbi:hypothetical protein CKO28_04950 [Rhodovibrio sodomensis]|uniref:site-specific DNA-methyltransferase (adenine-specific) n=1 Tax=Rhodovibrio sodomensis TaxID=1088 RepID=A0ABS1DBQ7_9PROT|nr:DNA methyltransferase [Rhodovibrio sodomensis]MBK1667376.1 hypothetical protein [Rhodovibrio sodomensis]